MGRPRSTEARDAAIEATVGLLMECGTEGVTLEAVAARSGVAKSTLYRHFGTKAALVLAAGSSCFVDVPTPDTGSLAEDLRILVERMQAAEEERRLPDVMPALLAAGTADPEMAALVQTILAERRRPLRTVLQLAQLRGEIRRDVDIEDACALFIGPLVFRRMVDRAEVSPEFRSLVQETVLAGLLATAPQPASTGA